MEKDEQEVNGIFSLFSHLLTESHAAREGLKPGVTSTFGTQKRLTGRASQPQGVAIVLAAPFSDHATK